MGVTCAIAQFPDRRAIKAAIETEEMAKGWKKLIVQSTDEYLTEDQVQLNSSHNNNASPTLQHSTAEDQVESDNDRGLASLGIIGNAISYCKYLQIKFTFTEYGTLQLLATWSVTEAATECCMSN